MADIRGYAEQRNPGLSTGWRGVKLNYDGTLAANSREGLVDAWTRDGRVFISSNPTIGTPETMSAAGTAYTLTAPSIRFSVPSGVVAVPIHVQLEVATVIAKNDLFAVMISDTDTFTSGGEACAPARNALVQSNSALRSTAVTNLVHSDTAIIEAAVTRTRTLKAIRREGQTGELNTTWMPEYNILKGDPMVYLVGPASFLVFAVQETTAAEAEWTMSWAELDTQEVP